MWMIAYLGPSLPHYMSKRSEADSHGRNDRWLKASSLCCPFPLIFAYSPVFLSSTPTSVVLWFTLYPLTVHSLYSLFLLLSTCTRVLRSVTWQWTSPSYGTAISSLTILRRLKVPLPSITARPEGYKALNPQGDRWVIKITSRLPESLERKFTIAGMVIKKHHIIREPGGMKGESSCFPSLALKAAPVFLSIIVFVTCHFGLYRTYCIYLEVLIWILAGSVTYFIWA